jgi:RHS repeat-associated protein
MQLGNGRWESTQFNNRLQPTQIALGATQNTANLLKLDFNYGTSDNNGNVKTQITTVPSTAGQNNGFTATQTYNYDSLNRLKDASETIGSQTWKQTYKYDRFGNREFDAANTTTLGGCSQAVCNPSINTADNRFNTGQGYSYDSAGNLKTDAEGKQFTYDADNKQTEVKNQYSQSIGTYFYDADGKRVKKLVPSTGETTIFVYDASGKLVAEYSTIVETTNAKVGYLTNDHLGSPRIVTDRNGNVTSRRDFLPFGEEIGATPQTQTAGRNNHSQYVGDNTRQKFTSYERDIESDLDFAQARYYKPSHGRFTSPDEPFADQFEDNPQSWNLYLYARNNPLNLTDPFGMSAGCPDNSPEGCYERDGKYYVKVDGEEREYDPTPIQDPTPMIIESPAPKCSPSNPCRTELPDSGHDWVPGWGSFRQMMWNIRCQETGGCNANKALFYFGMTAFEATPLGAAVRGISAARAVPSIVKSLCFVEGTLVLTEDGLKPIEEIRKGDKVLSYNEKTKRTEYKTVVQTMVREAEAGRILSLKVEGEGEALGVTGEHPFYVRVHKARDNTSGEDDEGEWREAGNLKVGDEIRKADGTWAKVESISQRSEGAKVYNFTVKDNHNYFVGLSNLLVHNGICDIIWKKVMTSREVAKELTKNGFELVGQKGSHMQFKYPGSNVKVTVPNHAGDLPRGTLNSIKKQVESAAGDLK